jgi:hypothetical protein
MAQQEARTHGVEVSHLDSLFAEGKGNKTYEGKDTRLYLRQSPRKIFLTCGNL